MSFLFTRLGRLPARAAAVAVTVAVLASCGAEAPTSEEMWVLDAYVQCNDFDEPFRECLRVSHTEYGPYRHLEGAIQGFEFEEGTRYVLEVAPLTAAEAAGGAPWKLIKVISTR